MTAPYEGKAASFYTGRGTSASRTDQAMSQVGSTKMFYITDRTRAWWDPLQPVVVYDDDVEVPDCHIHHAGGYVELPASHSIVGAITVDCYTKPLERLGGGFGWSASKKGNAVESTVFPAIAATLANRSYVGSGITEWTATLKRHFWYARAWMQTAIAGDNNDLLWTWKPSGSFGNLESVEYVAGGALEIVRADNKTTVTYVAAATTAAQVKAHLEADPVLSLMWELSYPAGNDGSGVVGDVANTLCTGGRDSLEQLAELATKVLAVFYLETAAATSARLEGVGIMTNLNLAEPLETLVEADLDFQGTGPFDFHSN